ncbi:MAG TPA: MurR/RpiR family transcriptional regulator [Erysipelotrichaceae bacterium]|nr:MurR/RpiR family transcriptional regulator [Erysipelotrichaceae bacterium]
MNDSTLELIQLNLYQFTKNERILAEYILEDPMRVIQSTAEKVAEDTSTSKAAFIRFCQKLGYNGYSEFRFALSRSMVATVTYSGEDPIQQITNAYTSFIQQIPSMISMDQVQSLAKSIINARRLKFFGINRTALSALQLRKRLSRIGYDAEVIDDQVVMGDVSEYLGEGDVCVVFSIKAMTQTYGSLIPEMASRNVKVILLTMTPNNKFVDLVNQMIVLPFISKSSTKTFYDDQAIFFVFIEILLNEIARLSQE